MKKNMWKKGLVLGIIVLFVGASIIPSMSSTSVEKDNPTDDRTAFLGFNTPGDILYVGGSGPNNYTKIQDAIDDASNGDTVFVYDDSSPYYENIIINKPLNLIGENKYTTIIEPSSLKYAQIIEIISSNVSISGFTIQNCRQGIFIGYSDNVYNILISGNIIQNNDYHGIHAGIMYNSNISNNIITDNIHGNIQLFWASNNVLYGNTCANSSSQHQFSEFSCGIELFRYCNNNTIQGNTFINNYFGVWFHEECENNIILENTFENNTAAIMDGAPAQKKSPNVIYSENSLQPTVVIRNNFKKNRYNKGFAGWIGFFDTKTSWDKNYWGRTLIFPKIVIGFLLLPIGFFLPGNFQIDWHPAQEPYDIPRVAI